MRAYNAPKPAPPSKASMAEKKKTNAAAAPGAPSDESKSKSKSKNPPSSKSEYARARDAEERRRRAEHAANRAPRAPKIIAAGGVRLPAGVTTAAAAPRTRARLSKTTGASLGPSPGVPWRVNANVARDVTDPISVAFAEAKRVKALEEARDARAASARKKSSGGGGSKASRPSTFRVSAVGAVEPARTVPRRSYPNFRDWLAAQTDLDAANAARDARLGAARGDAGGAGPPRRSADPTAPPPSPAAAARRPARAATPRA